MLSFDFLAFTIVQRRAEERDQRMGDAVSVLGVSSGVMFMNAEAAGLRRA
jgi:hypothetical protein